jgi:hypothetical protein
VVGLSVKRSHISDSLALTPGTSTYSSITIGRCSVLGLKARRAIKIERGPAKLIEEACIATNKAWTTPIVQAGKVYALT